MTPVEKILVETIRRHGPVRFKDFMETALYHPEKGYYTSRTGQISPKGDYYTAGSLGPLFGKLLARQFAEMWRQTGDRTVVEMGAGNGTLARDILSEMRSQGDSIRYLIVERSPVLRAAQETRLAGYEVTWYSDLRDLPPVVGIFFSNELLDAFPVHAVEMTKEGLKEVYVDWREGIGFMETLHPPSTPELASYFERLGVNLPVGFRAEVNLAAIAWLRDVARKLTHGFLLTIDYGYPARELYQNYRRRGTLMAYERHRARENLYANVGQRDLTAHVNFSALAQWGESEGLSVTGFTDQTHFLLSLGILDILPSQNTPDALKLRLNAKALLLPGGMGETFKVLIQHKGLSPSALSGLRLLPRRASCRI